MNQAVLGLTLTYVALAALVLAIFLLTRLPVWIKFTFVLAVSGFYYLTFYSLQGLLGWPTQQTLPDQFQLMASSIIEPDEDEGEAGRIHIWATSFIDNKPAPEPRAYELPYDLELHSALEAALKEQRRGNIQLGRKKEGKTTEDMARDLSKYGSKREKIEFFDLPDPEVPEK
jgi:hypothetical protein